jgi:hypothetical protein
MTFAIIVLCVLSVFVIILKKLEDKTASLGKQQRDSESRIGGLEVKDYAQDLRLDAQQRAIKGIKGDVRELGKDIGWGDEKRRTQVIKKFSDEDE